MASGSRDLKVRFVGDAGNLKSAFKEVSASAQASSVGLRAADDSANRVGTSFVKTGKVFRGVGKAFKSSGSDAALAGTAFASTIPALSGVAGGAGQALLAVDSLSSVLSGAGPAGLAIVAGAAIAGAAAYALLHDDVSAATDAMRAQDEANKAAATSHRATTDAVYAHKDALAALRGAALSNEDATLGVLRANERLTELNKQGGKDTLEYRDAVVKLETAQRKVTTATADHGRNSLEARNAMIAQEKATKKVAEAEQAGSKTSLEYRQAVLDQKRAQDALRNSRSDVIRQAEKTIEQTHKTSKAIDDEVSSTKKAADAARSRAIGLRTGWIAGKDAAGAAKEVKRALDAESKAATQSANKHRENASRAREMAAAIGTATPRAKALHDRLIELSQQELNTSQWIAALNAAANAASNAAAAIGRASAAAANVGSAARSGGGGSGRGSGGRSLFGKGAKEVGGGGGKFSSELMAAGGGPVGTRRGGSASPRTASEAAEALISGRHRDDTTQDKILGARAIAGASAAGVTNPDKLDEIGQRAVLANRKKEIKADVEDVKRAVKRVNAQIRKKRGELADLRVARRNAHGATPEKTAALQAALTVKIRAKLEQIRTLFDERRALNTEASELQAEAKDIGYDINVLSGEIAAMPDVVPADDSGSSATPDTGTGADTGAAGVSPDAQAQIDQANTRAAVATRGQAIADSFARTLFGSGSIDPSGGSVTVNINTLHPGDPQIQGEIASWVVGALGGQGSVPTSAYAAGV